MKKIGITLITLLALGLGFWGIFHHRTPTDTLAGAAALKGQQPTSKVSSHATPAANAKETKAAKDEDAALEATYEAERERERHEDEARSRHEYNTPISFYGLVLDQFDQPVADAKVAYASVGGSFEGERTLFSDAQGLFAISGVRGKRLRIIVSHPGYYDFDQAHSYYVYAGNYRGPDFKPNSAKPEIFRLRKKGEAAELIHQYDHILFTKEDGHARSFSLIDHTRRRDRPEYVILQGVETAEHDKQGKPIRRLEMVVPGGGIQLRTDPFAFVAPNEGYQPSMYFMRPEFGGKLDYFVKFSTGNYGRFTIMGSAGDYLIDSYFNPDNSPNLEYDPAKEITVVRNGRMGVDLVYPTKKEEEEPKKP